MYSSLVGWCKQDITVVRPGKLLPTGEHSEDTEFIVKGLLVDDSRLITDKNGQIATCRSYAYVIPSTPVEETDRIKLPGSNKKYDIRKLGGYYDGNTGELSVQVVYL